MRGLEALHQWLLAQAEWLLEQRDEIALALGNALLEAGTAEDETDDECSLLGRVPHLLALPGKAYAGLLPSTALRQALLWIGRAGTLGSTAQFIRDVLEPWMVGVSQRLPEVLGMAQRFANCGKVLADVTANVDFTGFNLTDYFEKSVGPWARSPHDGDELDAIDVLGKRHAHRALASAQDRLQRLTQLAALNRAQPLIRDTGFVRSELRQAMAGGFSFLPGNTNTPPWLRCDDDAAPMLAYLNAFTAMLALALRAAAGGRLSYRAFVTTIIQEHGLGSYRNAVRLVHEVAPELLGYYLLLWELLLRTAPPPAPTNA